MESSQKASDLRERIVRLNTIRDTTRHRREQLQHQADSVSEYLRLAPAVESRLEFLSNQMFGQLVQALELNLTVALQEVLEQPLEFKIEHSPKRGTMSLDFYVERDGEREHILNGQGGSVANVLSVGLRFFALATLDEAVHSHFLVLDEQDCWLRPDLVPQLVKIVCDAGRSLGFQVLMISHHDISAFSTFADRVYQLVPAPDGVQAKEWYVGQPEENLQP